MKLVSRNVEYRNMFSKLGKNGTYFIGTFEDEDGMPFEIYLGNKAENIPDFSKGHVYDIEFDYDFKYKQLIFAGIV